MKKIIIIIILLPLFITPCYASNIIESGAEALDAYGLEEALDGEELQISGELTLDGSYDTQGAVERLLKHICEAAINAVRETIKDAAIIVELSFLCALFSAFCAKKEIAEYIGIACCCAVALLSIDGVDSVISQAASALVRLSDYSKIAMPVMFSASAATGAVTSATGRYMAVCITLDLLMSLGQKLILPLIYSYLALCIANSVFSNSIIRSCALFMKWAVTTIMTVMTVAFSAYIGVTGLISGSVDAAMIKATRSVISTVLPIVGSIASDSASTVLSAMGIIKNSLGVFGLISVCALCIEPFAMLGIKLLLFKAAGAISDMASCARLSALVSDISKALGMLLGLVGSCAIILFISFMSAIKVAV